MKMEFVRPNSPRWIFKFVKQIRWNQSTGTYPNYSHFSCASLPES